MIGKTLSHYKILSKLGGGGMGVVYKAEDTKLDRPVALKLLPPEFMRDEETKQRFIHEAKAVSQLQHNNICTVHDIDETEEGQLFICMDCYEGETLKEKLSKGEISIDEAIEITIGVVKGLSAAHEKGIIHRDIKPANIFITNKGEVKILDFGLAKVSGQTKLTKMGSTVGTVAYMSPEQASGGKIDQRTDIWSSGVVLYEMLTGKLPFESEYEQAMVYSIINEEPVKVRELNEDVSEELEAIVDKCLRKDPNERYQIVEEILIEFKKFSKEYDTSFDESLTKLVRRLWHKKVVRRISIASAAVIILFLGWMLLWPKVTEPVPIAVISFENQTGDSNYDVYSKSIPNLLITNLEQSGRFRVATWERLNDLKRQLGKEEVEFIDSELGIQLCSMEGIENIVVGSIAKIGDIFATDLKVLDVESKEIIRTAQSRGEGENSIFEQIDKLTKDITTDLGGMSEEKYTETQRSVMELTTNSMEAYNYFLRGREEYEKSYLTDAEKFLERAILLDSTFAIAYLYIGIIYLDIYHGRTDPRKGLDALNKAFMYKNKLSEKERLMIESEYVVYREIGNKLTYKVLNERLSLRNKLVDQYPKEKRFHFNLGDSYYETGNYNKAVLEFEKAIELDPNYAAPHIGLGKAYKNLEEKELAIDFFRKYISISPGDAWPYHEMGEMYLYMGDLEKAKLNYKEALFIKPGFKSAYWLSYIYALEEKFTKAIDCMKEFISVNQGEDSGEVSAGTFLKSVYEVFIGDKEGLVGSLNEHDRLFTDSNSRQLAKWILGWFYFEYGDYEKSKNNFELLIDIQDDINDQTWKYKRLIQSNFALSMIELKEGEIDSPKSRLEFIKSNYNKVNEGLLTPGIEYWIKFLTIEILLAENKSDSALIACKRLTPFEHELSLWYSFFPCSKDIIPRTLVVSGKIDRAITEYEKLITYDPSIWDLQLIYPKYHYRLAKLYDQTDQFAKAKKEYSRFIELWKNADKKLPELIDAKKRVISIIE